MKKLAYLILALAVPACTQVETTDALEGGEAAGEAPAVPASATVTQTQAFRALERESGASWRWLQHPQLKTPMHLEVPRGVGEMLAPRGAEAPVVVDASLSFLAKHKDLFRLRDPRAELRLRRAETDERAMTHVRFEQVTHGVPVVGAEIGAHFDADGRVTSIDATYVPGLEGLDLEPALSLDDGAALAVSDVTARTAVSTDRLTTNEGRLVVFALEGRAPVLAYEYSVRAVFGHEPAIWVTTVDAKTGDIVDRYNNIQTIEASALGVRGTQKTFRVSQSGASYVMVDATRGPAIRTFTANNAETIPGTAVSSTSLTTWDRTTNGAGAAVDAHAHAAMVLDYYKNVHARNAIDGAGGALVSTAHFGSGYDNAFWDPDRSQMAYGDGASMFFALSAALDVVAHEFTHGVISATSDLRYQGQSGALNEAVADIFGAYIEHSVNPDQAKNWTLGEEIARQPGLVRDFRQPSVGDQPAHMSQFVNTQQDNGGVHINSGIINHTAYLMTVGGANVTSRVQVPFGIGWEKAEKVWYHANTRYFQTTTNFAQAAAGVISAARDLGLSQNEQNIVDCAWKASGVVQGNCATITDPSLEAQNRLPGAADDEGGEGEVEGTDETTGTTTTGARRRRTVLKPQDSAGCSASARAPFGRSDAAVFALGAIAVVVTLRRRSRR